MEAKRVIVCQFNSHVLRSCYADQVIDEMPEFITRQLPDEEREKTLVIILPAGLKLESLQEFES